MYIAYLNDLEERWEDILEEYRSVSNTEKYFEKDLYVGNWDVYPFLFFGEHFVDNQEACPKTWALLKDIPGLTTASFSILRPHTEIHPHTGFTPEVLRYHLGLEIPEDCAITVCGRELQWEQGKVLIFDDTQEHSAYNRSDRDRVVLLFDVKKDS
jgi:beta-hydroxylase